MSSKDCIICACQLLEVNLLPWIYKKLPEIEHLEVTLQVWDIYSGYKLREYWISYRASLHAGDRREPR